MTKELEKESKAHFRVPEKSIAGSDEEMEDEKSIAVLPTPAKKNTQKYHLLLYLMIQLHQKTNLQLQTVSNWSKSAKMKNLSHHIKV